MTPDARQTPNASGSMSALIVAFLGVALLVFPLGTLAAPPPEGTLREFRVREPVFQGEVLVLEGGDRGKPDVVLVHGLGDLASGTWAALLPELTREYHVVAFDLPGFGSSEKGNKLYSPARYAEFVDWVVGRYVDHPFSLVGHSMGGTIALHYTSLHPQKVEKLILVDAAGVLHHAAFAREVAEPQMKAGATPQVDAILRTILEWLPQLPLDFHALLQNETLRAQLLGGDPIRIAAVALVADDLSTILPRVRAPTLLLWGQDDAVTPVRIGELLESVLPRARLCILPGAGHMPMFDQTALFNRAVLEALGTPGPQPRPPRKLPGGPVGRCQGETGKVFRGDFEKIEISGCRDVRLEDVSARSVVIANSTGSIRQGRIQGGGTALKISDSEISATGLWVEGETALQVAGSRLDLAGVHLEGSVAAVRGEGRSEILFSVSRVKSPHANGYLHGFREIRAGEPL